MYLHKDTEEIIILSLTLYSRTEREGLMYRDIKENSACHTLGAH